MKITFQSQQAAAAQAIAWADAGNECHVIETSGGLDVRLWRCDTSPDLGPGERLAGTYPSTVKPAAKAAPRREPEPESEPEPEPEPKHKPHGKSHR